MKTTIMKPLNFVIEQVALCPNDPAAAIALLTEIGLSEWARDHVVARGTVRGQLCENQADLAFNYQATSAKDLELEVLHYTTGKNWMEWAPNTASHLAMHVTAEELERWADKFSALGIKIVQAVMTESHTNPVIDGKRLYKYVIFDTREILSIDLKFIVRRDV